MSDEIVRMPPPVQITDEDLEITETSCRANAARCRREGVIPEAAHWPRIADAVPRARIPRRSSER
jgi:hypothetical protein